MATDNPDGSNREKIAKTVTIAVLITVGIILIGAIVILLFKKDETDKSFSNFKDIVGTILPLLGTWLGTVLAYYFSKDNFDAATKSVNSLVSIVTADQKLKGIKANDPDVLIPLGSIKAYTFTSDAEMAVIKIKDMLNKMSGDKVLRLPFIDADKKLKYCIHRSIFDKYISIETINNNKNAADLTEGTEKVVQY